MPEIFDAARKRSTHDLIDELDAEAEHALLAAIVVGFPTKASLVFAADMNRLSALNRLIRKAGRPVGIVALRRTGGGLHFSCRPFQEYENGVWARRYLLEFGDVVRALYHGKPHSALFCPTNN